MSVTVDYFFNSEMDEHQLVAEINKCLGSTLKPSGDDFRTYFTQFMGLDFSFYEHDFESDRELNFEDYKYHVGIKTWAGDRYVSEIRVPLMAMIVFLLYHRLKIKGGMLVYDLQALLGRYEERITEDGVPYLFELLSQEFVGFPEHFVDLNATSA